MFPKVPSVSTTGYGWAAVGRHPVLAPAGEAYQFQISAELRNCEPSPASGSVDAPAGAPPMLRLERTPTTTAITAVRPNSRLLVRGIGPPSPVATASGDRRGVVRTHPTLGRGTASMSRNCPSPLVQ